ncbi:MAG: spore maturation protein [Proteobacteria bacterium]|nr:spore maturation protein [Pseudomonadota bacterium]
MLNWIWFGLILGALVYAGFHGTVGEVETALLDATKSAVQLVIGLVGMMVFMLGLTRVAFEGGLRDAIARALAPILRRIFPEVPPDHPAMAAMIMNMASNVMGLGNAATPFGLKAMAELARLNPHPGTATNAMVLFLAINTSAITLMAPTGTIAVRLAAGSEHATAIWIPTLIATICSTTAAVTAFFALRRLPGFRPPPATVSLPDEADAATATEVADEDSRPAAEPETPTPPAARWALFGTAGAIALAIAWQLLRPADGADPAPSLARLGFAGIVAVVLAGLAAGLRKHWLLMGALLAAVVFDTWGAAEELSGGPLLEQQVQRWAFPLLVGGLLIVGVRGRVRLYETMVEGAREGLEVAVRIVPYLVAILAAVAMFRASGALDELIRWIAPFTEAIGVPAEVMPMALLRPLSGSGAFAIMSETLEAHGPDSFIGYLTSTLMGSTETTFYVLALYLGAARVHNGRHALAACLIGDVAGFFGAVVACHWFFG